MSAVQFQRQLGLRYETAFQILHKLRAGMVRPERDSIGAQYPVEVDETLVGGRTKGEGRGVHHKAIVVGAVEVRPRALDADGKKRKKALYAGRLRLRLAPNRGATHGVRAGKRDERSRGAHRWMGRLRWVGNVGVCARAHGTRG